jgi:hypothetical protein
MRRRPKWLACRLGRCSAGDDGGSLAILLSPIVPDAAASRIFPPLDRALVQAMACETVAETKLPLSRQSVADLTSRAGETLGKAISRSSVWRMLHEDAIKPWQYEHWIFPRDPLFAEKASRILDLYAGYWEGQRLGARDYVLSSDEKTSIQARHRRHDEQPPDRAEGGASKVSMSVVARCSTWRRGMCIAAWCWDVARSEPAFDRLDDW